MARPNNAQIIEPLLKEDDNRFVMFPIKDKQIWDIDRKSVV